jgi:2'-5' RNA ligase
MLFQDQPQVRALAETAQNRLARFDGLHMTPLHWLHMTVLVVGPSEEISPEQRADMLAEASRALSTIRPIKASLGQLFYHPEAVILGVRPGDALDPVFQAIEAATQKVTGRAGTMTSGHTWIPHMTLCYSTAEQPAEPIISTLGTELPSCDITIRSVSLVDQRGAERSWNWKPVGTAHLGTTETSTT